MGKIKHITHLTLQSQKTEALLGMSNSRPSTDMCNSLSIMMKYYIFKKKLKETTPVFNEFKAFLKYRIKTEEYLSLINNKYGKHCSKWQHFLL